LLFVDGRDSPRPLIAAQARIRRHNVMEGLLPARAQAASRTAQPALDHFPQHAVKIGLGLRRPLRRPRRRRLEVAALDARRAATARAPARGLGAIAPASGPVAEKNEHAPHEFGAQNFRVAAEILRAAGVGARRVAGRAFGRARTARERAMCWRWHHVGLR